MCNIYRFSSHKFYSSCQPWRNFDRNPFVSERSIWHMTVGISFPLNFHCHCDDDEEHSLAYKCRPSSSLTCSTYLSNTILPSSPLPVVFPATRWLSLRLFTPSFNLNICVYASCYCTIMDILQCRFTYHTRCASQQQFDSSKMCSVCSRLSLDCAWDFNSTDNLSQRSTRKVGKTNWMELCTGLSLSSALELFPRKTNIQHMMVFLQIWILVSSASIVCSKLTICFSTANKERKLAWFSIFTRQARNEWTFPNNKYSSQRHIFSDIASKHTQPPPHTFVFAPSRLSQSSHQ